MCVNPAFMAGLEAGWAEMRELLACGHPKACWQSAEDRASTMTMCTAEATRPDRDIFITGRCTACVQEKAAIAALRKTSASDVINENGTFTQCVYEKVLIQGRCGVPGHFQFQQNGNSCLLCQDTVKVERLAFARGIQTGEKRMRELAALKSEQMDRYGMTGLDIAAAIRDIL